MYVKQGRLVMNETLVLQTLRASHSKTMFMTVYGLQGRTILGGEKKDQENCQYGD